MASKSEQLRKDAAADFARVAELDDKAFIAAGMAALLCIVAGFAGFIAFASFWMSHTWGKNPPTLVMTAYSILLVLGALVFSLLLGGAWNLYRSNKLRKQAKAMQAQAGEVEKSERELAAKKDEAAKAAVEAQRLTSQKLATEDHHRAAVEASVAREAQARAEQAARVAKNVQDTRSQRSGKNATLGEVSEAPLSFENGPQRRSDGPNKPGGSPTQGKGR
jgi:hypothetical protein